MKFDQVLGTLKALKNCQRPGGSQGRLQIIDTFRQIRQLFPQTTLVWSYILPRHVWRNAINIEAIESAKDRLNRGVLVHVVKLGGKGVRHPEFKDKHRGLFAPDGVHLSDIGCNIFLNTYQGALEAFIQNPDQVVYV
jgi:hypothetical protein